MRRPLHSSWHGAGDEHSHREPRGRATCGSHSGYAPSERWERARRRCVPRPITRLRIDAAWCHDCPDDGAAGLRLPSCPSSCCTRRRAPGRPDHEPQRHLHLPRGDATTESRGSASTWAARLRGYERSAGSRVSTLSAEWRGSSSDGSPRAAAPGDRPAHFCSMEWVAEVSAWTGSAISIGGGAQHG